MNLTFVLVYYFRFLSRVRREKIQQTGVLAEPFYHRITRRYVSTTNKDEATDRLERSSEQLKIRFSRYRFSSIPSQRATNATFLWRPKIFFRNGGNTASHDIHQLDGGRTGEHDGGRVGEQTQQNNTCAAEGVQNLNCRIALFREEKNIHSLEGCSRWNCT